jgi:hypothetical protein
MHGNCGNRRTYNTMANRIRPHNVRQNTTQKTKRLSNTNPTRMNSGTPEMKAYNTENSSPCNAIGSKHSKRNYAEDDPFCFAWLVCSEVLRWPLRLVQL